MAIDSEEKKTRAQSYKAFYVRNLQVFEMTFSVRPRQAFPSEFNVCG